MSNLNALRKIIRANIGADETQMLCQLCDEAGLSLAARQLIAKQGSQLVRDVRANSEPSLMENFLGEFGLSTKEGIAWMCLAEALLRIPDAPTH